MSVKKMTTVSIRVRQDDYAILQQHAQDNGLKCPAMFSQILAEWIEMHSLVKEDNSNGTDATGVAKIGEDVMNELNLPDYDVDGNKVGSWIKDHL